MSKLMELISMLGLTTLVGTIAPITSCSNPQQAITLRSITVTPPAITTYCAGDKLDLTGINVVANYSDTTKTLTSNDYTTSPANGETLKATDTKVTVAYQGKTTDFAITVYPVATKEEFLTKWGQVYSAFTSSTKKYETEDIANNILSGTYETSLGALDKMTAVGYNDGFQASYGHGPWWLMSILQDTASISSWIAQQEAAGGTFKYIVTNDRVGYFLKNTDFPLYYDEYNNLGYVTIRVTVNKVGGWYAWNNTYNADPSHS